MQFVKQSLELPVRNNDIHTSEGTPCRRHSELLPQNFRGIFAGSSGCGKTNALLSLIESENELSFENIYIYSKTLDQDKYKYLIEVLRTIKDLGVFTFITLQQNIIDPSQMRKNSLVVFDDIITDSQLNK